MHFGDAEEFASDEVTAVKVEELGVKGQFGRARRIFPSLGAASPRVWL